MRFEFIVDWGYRHIYFSEKYLPRLCFDGKIAVEDGTLTDVKRVQFGEDRFGCHVLSPTFNDYGKAEWTSSVCNAYDGFLFVVDGDEKTKITIKTASATAQFSLYDLMKKQHLTFDVENPFTFAVMHAYWKEHEWYLAERTGDEIRLMGKDFDGEQNSFFGVNGVIVPCGKRTQGVFSFDTTKRADEDVEVEGAIRVIQSASEKTDMPVNGVADYEVLINGQSVYRNSKFSCNWDDHSQHFEETFFPVPVHLLQGENNAVQILNHDIERVILVQMVRIFVKKRKHLQIVSCPKWTIKGKVFSVKLYARYPVNARIVFKGGVYPCTPDGRVGICASNNNILVKGENEYFFKTDEYADSAVEIVFIDEKRGVQSVAKIAEVWTGAREKIEPKTGIEIKLDSPETYEYYFHKLLDEQLGNYVMFRRYGQWNPRIDKVYDIAVECKKYGVYTDVITVGWTVKSWLAEAIVDGSGEWNLAVGDHEATGLFYWGEYFDNPEMKTMEEAERACVDELASICQALKTKNAKTAMGDASGGARYAYRAGFDILRHETYCGHHLTILPDARGSARAYDKPVWGAHIASQHNFQAELDTAIGRYWLANYLPWVFGANFIFEEDSLFQNNKYYRMVNDDYMTKEKQKVTADFFKHIQTHARLGAPSVKIGFIQGRHQAPFTALSTCNGAMERVYHNEDRRIWGKHGAPQKEWGHRQAEKDFHLLEVVAPQIYLPPLNQDPYKTRKLFSANPYGEWDFLPVEATQEAYAQYDILFMLGWNSMKEESVGVRDGLQNDYARLRAYVQQGGVVALSVPQLSKRTDRGLLGDWENADLYEDGAVSDLFGVRIGKPCEEISLQCAVRNFPKKEYTEKRDFIRLPYKEADEDGECRLAEIILDGAEVCLVDENSGKPLLIRNKVGKGYAYLLCAYAYFGHEKLKYISANILQTLIELHTQRDIVVEGEDHQIYASDWKNGLGGKLYLLNIDWTKTGGKRRATIVRGERSFVCEVEERKILEIAYQKDSAVYALNGDVNVVADQNEGGRYALYGFGECALRILSQDGVRIYIDGKERANTQTGDTEISVTLRGEAVLQLQKE